MFASKIHNLELRDIWVHTNCFLICGVSGIIADNTESFCQPSFYQIKTPATLPFKTQRTPHMFCM